MPFLRAQRKFTSTSTHLRSTRTSKWTYRSSAIVRMCLRTWCVCGVPAPFIPTRNRCRRGGRRSTNDVIKPQYAIQRLYELTKDKDCYITTEVGQHQMWAAQFYGFQEPNRWMTSGGLGTMGY